MPEGVISGDPNNPVYLRYGGNVVMQFLWPSSQNSTRLWEQTLGEVARNKFQGDTVMLGSFPQWTKFQFWVIAGAYPEVKWYPFATSAEVVDPVVLSTLDFYLQTFSPGDTIPWPADRVWGIDVTRDDALAAMPPPEVLAYFGNPFVPSQEIEIPADGTVYMVVDRANQLVQDDLYMDIPTNQLFLADLRNHVDDTLHFGRMSAGETVRFYIRSFNTIVSGQNLYPETLDEAILGFKGEILFKALHFEDWTDMLLDDVICSLYLIPDHLGDFPWPMQVQLTPAVIAPGDTADVVLRKRNEDGSLQTFPDTVNFDVEILESWQYGTIYSPNVGDTSDFFIDIPQGFQFIAKDSIDTDSVFVPIAVNTSGGIITAAVQPNPGGVSLEKVTEGSARAHRIESMQEQHKKSVLDRKNAHSPGGRGMMPEDGGPDDFSYGIGEVLITSAKHEILLGETKYYQAKLAGENLKIEEVNGPQLNGGIADSLVWRDSSVTVVSGGKLGYIMIKNKPSCDQTPFLRS